MEGTTAYLVEKNGGDDGTRTRGLCRDRRQFNRWRTQNQQVACAVVGNRWRFGQGSEAFVIRFVSTKGLVGLAVVSPAKAPRTVRFCAAPTRRYNHLPVGV